jgi:IS4 transposase
MMMQDALPEIKPFFRIGSFSEGARSFVLRMMIAFMFHAGRMSASQVAVAVRTDVRHRAQVSRFLSGSALGNGSDEYQCFAAALIAMESRRRGRWLFLIDKTCTSRQGQRTQNTFSTGNRKRRPRKGRRYNQKKNAPKRCHGFVMGLLITPSGYRIPFHRCYYTQEYCKQNKLDHRTEAELGAALVRALPVPEGVEVVVLGDTAYEAASVRGACEERGFTWITPANPERVLAGEKPRPRVSSRISDMTARQFSPIRLVPTQGDYVRQRRVSACRIGPKAKTRTFYARKERLLVHNVGTVQVVFSTKEKPENGKPIDRKKTKILMTNHLKLSAAEIVELYDLRWQIELFFKELKSTLGFHQYRFVDFAAVESWVECCLITYLYLEWYRAKRLSRRGLSKKAKRWWSCQRTHGLCQAVAQEAECKELNRLADWSHTPAGLKKLKRLVRAARPPEYQTVT